MDVVIDIERLARRSAFIFIGCDCAGEVRLAVMLDSQVDRYITDGRVGLSLLSIHFLIFFSDYLDKARFTG